MVTSGGRRQAAGVLRWTRTQSEDWRQVARRAPRLGGGRGSVGVEGSSRVIVGGGNCLVGRRGEGGLTDIFA